MNLKKLKHAHTSNALFFFLIFTMTFSCLDDVPHTNPIDPNGKNQGFSLFGKVTTLYAPVQSIPNAVITLLPDNNKFFSNSTGNFEITGLAPGDYTVLCKADGYNQDSLLINLKANQTIEFFLDGLPFFKNIAITTHHISRFFPVNDLFFLQINTQVDDLDGIADIHEVLFDIPELAVSDTLQVSLEAGTFAKRLSIDDLPVNTIQSLTGRAIILTVTDDAGVRVKSEKRFLTRVIELTPSLIEPVNLQTAPSDSIRFSWEKVRLPYWFSQSIEIFQIIQGIQTKAAEINNIKSVDVDVVIANTLPPADYVWILTITDEFGNTSSSKEGSFHVNN
jgi:Carboxypeptidase regulatory-like domain